MPTRETATSAKNTENYLFVGFMSAAILAFITGVSYMLSAWRAATQPPTTVQYGPSRELVDSVRVFVDFPSDVWLANVAASYGDFASRSFGWTIVGIAGATLFIIYMKKVIFIHKTS